LEDGIRTKLDYHLYAFEDVKTHRTIPFHTTSLNSKASKYQRLNAQESNTIPGNRASGIAKDGTARLEKASRVVENLGVKQHVFQPSGITIWTVVGMDGDFLVDVSSEPSKQYCSCSDFHYRVLSGKVAECYHLIAARLAINKGRYSTTTFRDDELSDFLKALLGDLYAHLE